MVNCCGDDGRPVGVSIMQFDPPPPHVRSWNGGGGGLFRPIKAVIDMQICRVDQENMTQ